MYFTYEIQIKSIKYSKKIYLYYFSYKKGTVFLKYHYLMAKKIPKSSFSGFSNSGLFSWLYKINLVKLVISMQRFKSLFVK